MPKFHFMYSPWSLPGGALHTKSLPVTKSFRITLAALVSSGTPPGFIKPRIRPRADSNCCASREYEVLPRAPLES